MQSEWPAYELCELLSLSLQNTKETQSVLSRQDQVLLSDGGLFWLLSIFSPQVFYLVTVASSSLVMDLTPALIKSYFFFYLSH